MSAHSKDEGLRECPFCGVIPEPPFQNLMDDEDDNIVSVFTMAHQCKQLGNTFWVSATEHDDVVAAWNRRSSAERGMREALEPLVKAWDDYQEKASSARSEGQADAYYMLAKYLRADWEKARAALSARAGEGDEQATRGEDAATASTDRL